MEVNSGGQVFFCFFNPQSEYSAEGLLVLKFHTSRLITQSEQFANELTRHLGVCAPNCRILRETVGSLPSFFPGPSTICFAPAAFLPSHASQRGLLEQVYPNPSVCILASKAGSQIALQI